MMYKLSLNLDNHANLIEKLNAYWGFTFRGIPPPPARPFALWLVVRRGRGIVVYSLTKQVAA